MGPRYRYDPPRSHSNWLERLAPLKEPPQAYLIALIGIVLGIYFSTSSNPNLRQFGPRLLILLIAFPLHELAHAIVADRLGDLTPRYNGRITLNPLAQLNFIGSFLMLFIGLGWAYVPINPSALRPNPRVGHMFVAIAGPVANLCLAIICAILWHVLNPVLQTFNSLSVANHTFNILTQFALINMALLFFNLVPIVPLDGFFVLKGLLPYQLAYQLEALQRYGFLIFLLFFFILPLIGLPILDVLIFTPAAFVTRLLFGLL
jgi:Zn-dependent protease